MISFKTMKTTAFAILFFSTLSTLVFAQNKESRNPSSEIIKTEEHPKIIEKKPQVQAFIHAIEQMLLGNDIEIDTYFFKEEEAFSFSENLINLNYPDADSSLPSGIMKRNEAVRIIFESHKKRFTRVKMVRIDYRTGHTPDVEAFKIVLTFGDADTWLESLSLLLVILEDDIKILSLKDES